MCGRASRVVFRISGASVPCRVNPEGAELPEAMGCLPGFFRKRADPGGRFGPPGFCPVFRPGRPESSGKTGRRPNFHRPAAEAGSLFSHVLADADGCIRKAASGACRLPACLGRKLLAGRDMLRRLAKPARRFPFVSGVKLVVCGHGLGIDSSFDEAFSKDFTRFRNHGKG